MNKSDKSNDIKKLNKKLMISIIKLLNKPFKDRNNYEISQIIEFFKEFSLFEYFPTSKLELINLVKNIEYKVFASNDIIIKEGEINKKIYFIFEGTVMQYKLITIKNDEVTKYFPKEV